MNCYSEEDFGEDRGRVVWLIQALSCMVSLLGSCFILVNYFVLSQGKNPLVKLVAWLSLGDVGWVLVKLVHFVLNSMSYNWTSYYFTGCVTIRLLWQFFAGTTIFWTCCISFFLWRVVCRKERAPSYLQWILFHAVSWGLPLLSVVALAVGGDNTMKHSAAMGTCYPTWYLHIFLWFFPVVLCFIFNVVFYVLIAWNIRRTLKLIPTLTPKRASRVYRKFTLYILVYIVCWPLDIINSVIFYSMDMKCRYFLLICLYAALLNLQGFLNFLVYGFTNKKIFIQFFGGNLLNTLKAFAVFFLSPLLVIPAMVWYVLARKIYGKHKCKEMTKEEVEQQKRLMEAKRQRIERSERMAKKMWESPQRQQDSTRVTDALDYQSDTGLAGGFSDGSGLYTPMSNKGT